MLKNFISGFILVFILLMIYLFAINFILMFTAEGLGLYENIPLFIFLALALNIAPFVILFITDRIKKKKLLAENELFLKTGTRADAMVMGVEDTGITINNDPVVRLTIEINSGSAGSFEKTIETTVSRILIPRKGDIIKVLYDQKDNSKITVLQ
ncbi:MAG TPA: hypothetical protein VK004_06150 [Ignavibacteria bacterium]|nr:hypothetical protein [Ignavibacteria bacterium]